MVFTASSGRFSAESRLQETIRRPGGAVASDRVAAAGVELAEVDPKGDLHQVRHAEAAEFRSGEGGGADDLVEGLRRAPVEPVGERVTVRHATDAEEAGEALVGDH